MEKHVNFSSRMGAIFAAAGSAVGLGNIWRFPMLVGDNGGAAFILIYILSILLIGIPIMVGEFVIGRHTQSNMIDAFRQFLANIRSRIGLQHITRGINVPSVKCILAIRCDENDPDSRNDFLKPPGQLKPMQA